MIDFACKKFKLEEIIKCGLGLTRTELSIFFYILNKKKWLNSKETAKKLKIDETTVQRAFKKFYEEKLVLRKQINLKKGGFSYIYLSEERVKIKEILMKTISNWTKRVEKELCDWNSKKEKKKENSL